MGRPVNIPFSMWDKETQKKYAKGYLQTWIANNDLESKEGLRLAYFSMDKNQQPITVRETRDVLYKHGLYRFGAQFHNWIKEWNKEKNNEKI
jgi:hypothetical protein